MVNQPAETILTQAKAQPHELAALLAITQEVASTLELAPLLGRILDQFKGVVDYDGAAILALAGDTLEVLAYCGPIPHAESLALRFPLANSHANRAVLDRRQPVIITDVRGATAMARAFQETAGAELDTTYGYIRSWMGVPLISRDQVSGIVSLDHHEPNFYSGRDSLLALTFATKAAVAIENARLYQEGQNRQRELQTLLDVAAAANSSLNLEKMLTTTLDRLVKLVDASRAGVMLSNPENGQLEPTVLRPEREIAPEALAELMNSAKKILATGEPLYVPPNKAKGYLEPGAFLPLRNRGELFGLIGIIGQEGTHFSPEQLTLFRSIADQLAVAVANARLYVQAQQAAAAAERNRLARELHDAVSQTLFSAGLIAEVLPQLWENNQAEGRRRLDELRELTRGALAEMRALLMELRPATLTEFSLADLLRQLAEATTGRFRLPVALSVSGERPLPPDVQIAFYRIAQEALHNIQKHAGANAVSLRLALEAAGVQMVIADDGRGFDKSSPPPSSLGLSIMRERAANIGANLKIISQIGQGTTVRVEWPPEETEDE